LGSVFSIGGCPKAVGVIAEALNGAVDKFWRIFWMTMVNRIMPEAMPAVTYFYTAMYRRSRGATWPIFAPALICRRIRLT
jgi:hypothetical protein